MLNKLLKHEYKATSRYMIPLYLILLITTILSKITLSLNVYYGVLSFIKNFLIVIYFFSLIIVGILTFVVLIERFYKNMVTNEGYLTFTLPAKTSQILNSKLIAAITWSLVSILLILVSLFIILPVIPYENLGIQLDISSSFFSVSPVTVPNLRTGLDLVYASIKSEFGASTNLFIAQFVATIFLSLVNKILHIYASIAIGQLFSKHKLISSVGAFVVTNIAFQMLMGLLLLIAAYFYGTSLEDSSAVPHLILPITITITVMINFIFYFTTTYIFKNRLNLE